MEGPLLVSVCFVFLCCGIKQSTDQPYFSFKHCCLTAKGTVVSLGSDQRPFYLDVSTFSLGVWVSSPKTRVFMRITDSKLHVGVNVRVHSVCGCHWIFYIIVIYNLYPLCSTLHLGYKLKVPNKAD